MLLGKMNKIRAKNAENIKSCKILQAICKTLQEAAFVDERLAAMV